MIFSSDASREWHASEIPGIQMSPMWSGEGDGAYFVRFEAGAEFPLHDHEVTEQIVVLAGRIRFGSVEMSSGDFLKSGPGDVHDALALEDTLLFVAHRGGIIVHG